jgi:flavorubredoxin
VTWLNECYPVGRKHEHVSAYLVKQNNQYILIDSGSYQHQENILQNIKEITDGTGVSAIILSHPDLPHSGNLRAIQEKWPETDIISFTSTPKIHGLEDVVSIDKESTRTIAGRKFRFIDPPLLDVPSTAWTYDYASGTLFTIDGFGLYHSQGDCETVFNTSEPEINRNDLESFYRDTLRWLQYIEPERLQTALEALFEDLDVRCIAPTHGNPVIDPAIDPYLRKVLVAISHISEEFTPPTANCE